MNYLISKADFPEFVPLATTLEDRFIEPYIRDAYQFEVLPLLLPAEWPLLSAAVQGPAPEAGVTVPELLVWAELRPFWVLSSYRLFLRWHGTHVSQAGLHEIQLTAQGSTAIGTGRRNELTHDIEARAAQYRARLEKALRQYRPLSTNTCGSSRNRRPGRGGARIYAI